MSMVTIHLAPDDHDSILTSQVRLLPGGQWVTIFSGADADDIEDAHEAAARMGASCRSQCALLTRTCTLA